MAEQTHTPATERRSFAAAAITVSDRCARGEHADVSGPELVVALEAEGYRIETAQVVPDGEDNVRHAIQIAMASGARLIITTGGTGISPRDRTPEGTRPLLIRELPGIPEALRRDGARRTPMAVLSRGLAGIAGGPPDALVVNLPGSVDAVREGLKVLLPLVPHVLDQLDGGDH